MTSNNKVQLCYHNNLAWKYFREPTLNLTFKSPLLCALSALADNKAALLDAAASTLRFKWSLSSRLLSLSHPILPRSLNMIHNNSSMQCFLIIVQPACY